MSSVVRRLLVSPVFFFLACSAIGRTIEAELRAAEPAATSPIKSPLSPEQSLAEFRLAKGLRIELVACEPEIVDPVAMRFDELGRLWVVEMRDYPNGPAKGQPPMSRIKLLVDADHDGRFEKATVFAENLLFATGLQPWQGGVIVTLSGKIAYMKDTDGDGKADVNETWFTGFAEENPQLRVNHPRFGMDNRIYVANGLRGGSIVATRNPKMEPVSIRGRDLRFDPRDPTTCEAISGNGQFGMTFDDFGNRFTCSNRNPLFHVVLEDRYLARNPLLAVPTVVQDVAAAGEASHVYPLSEAWTTSHLHAGQFTAACGVDIYRGDLLPAEYRGNSFTCEPTGNLVHREIVKPQGATFTATPAYERTEFLASRDTWFRPVNIESGPDGALYVVDMYRAVIEHPQFVPEELKNRPDERFGEDRGRIYRIVDEKPAFIKRRGFMRDAVVFTLSKGNAWQRETAARLIYERQDKSLQEKLEPLVRSGRGAVREHALWALQGMGLLSESVLLSALGDADPQALILAEGWLDKSAAVRKAVMAEPAHLSNSRSAFQRALCLGQIQSPEVVASLAQIAVQGAGDVWTRRAVCTAAPEQAAPILAAVLNSGPASAEPAKGGYMSLVRELCSLVGARREPTDFAKVAAALEKVEKRGGAEPLQLAVYTALAQGMRSRGTAFRDFLAQQAAGQPAFKSHADGLFNRAVELARDAKADADLRAQACDLLSYASYEVAGVALMEMVRREPVQELRLKAIAALGTQADEQVGPVLLEDFLRQTPAVRRALLDALLSQPKRAGLLLDEIAAGRIKPKELDQVRANKLLQHRDAPVRDRAKQLLAATSPADRTKVLAEYQSALALAADPRRGKEVFRKNCSTCHKVGDVGTDVGPSIADSRTKTPAQLLVDILQPSKAIDNNFISYTVITGDGQTLTGIIASETAGSVTIKMPEGKSASLLRSNIEELHSNGVSLMPEGLERTVPQQDMADVIGYIKNWRYLDGQVPTKGVGVNLTPAGK